MSQARMTVSRSSKKELQIFLNPAARRILVKMLDDLSASNDHFHLFSFKDDDPLALSETPYKPDDEVFTAVKVMLRLDEWDKTHFPHVMAGA